MPQVASAAAGRIAAVLPITLLSLFIGLLWLIGLAGDKDRRKYVTEISGQAMAAISSIWENTGSFTTAPARPSPALTAHAGRKAQVRFQKSSG
jgi:hypothetical protein